MRLVSPAHYARIVVKRVSSGTDAIRRATVSRRILWIATPLPGIASASRNGEVCFEFTSARIARIANIEFYCYRMKNLFQIEENLFVNV